LNSGVDPAGSADPWPELKWYRWVEDSSRPMPEPVDTVMRRFARSLPGYGGFPDDPNSWSEWLRLLPLAASGTPVRNYRGEIVVPGDDEQLAAVVAIDIGSRDLQQSADVLLRLHAEWRWYRGELRMLYLSDSKLELPLQKWGAGERLVAAGGQPKWVAQAAAKPKLDGVDFREYLEAVLAWSDGQALVAESVPLAPEGLEPGAFFLRQGHPADVLVVLDVATSPAGERAMLLAHARNPSENIHVIRPTRDTVWFPVRTHQPVRVPRAPPFGWKDLRRMKRRWSPPEVSCIGSLCPKTPPTPSASSSSPSTPRGRVD
jgi:hypothetical protein